MATLVNTKSLLEFTLSIWVFPTVVLEKPCWMWFQEKHKTYLMSKAQETLPFRLRKYLLSGKIFLNEELSKQSVFDIQGCVLCKLYHSPLYLLPLQK